MKTAKAFTLMELVLVVAIVSIVTSTVLLNMRSGKKETSLEIAQRQVASVLRELQNNALSGKQQTSGANKTCGYAIEYGLGEARNFQIKYYSASGCSDELSSLSSANLSDLGDATALKSSPTSKSANDVISFAAATSRMIYFAGPYGRPFKIDNSGNFTALSSSCVISLKSGYDTDVANVEISPSGVITERALVFPDSTAPAEC